MHDLNQRGLTFNDMKAEIAFNCSTTGFIMALNGHWCRFMEDNSAFEECVS
jgi:hypothetical protein